MKRSKVNRHLAGHKESGHKTDNKAAMARGTKKANLKVDKKELESENEGKNANMEYLDMANTFYNGEDEFEW
jgi:hypothetical protein